MKKPKRVTKKEIAAKFTLEDVMWAVIQEHRIKEEQRIAENIRFLEEQMDLLSEKIGRPLTEDEEESVLDIVDQYTPQDKDGNYLYPIIPFDYAWTIYLIDHESGNDEED